MCLEGVCREPDAGKSGDAAVTRSDAGDGGP